MSYTASFTPYRAVMGVRTTARMRMIKITSEIIAVLFLRNRRIACRVGETDSAVRPSVSSIEASLPRGASAMACGGMASSVKADPRVEPGVRKVSQQVEHNDGDRDEDHPRHDQREVAVAERLDEVATGAGVFE